MRAEGWSSGEQKRHVGLFPTNTFCVRCVFVCACIDKKASSPPENPCLGTENVCFVRFLFLMFIVFKATDLCDLFQKPS